MSTRLGAQRPVFTNRRVSCLVARPGSSEDDSTDKKMDQPHRSDEDKHMKKSEDSEMTTQKELAELLKEYKSILVAGANGGVGR